MIPDEADLDEEEPKAEITLTDDEASAISRILFSRLDLSGYITEDLARSILDKITAANFT